MLFPAFLWKEICSFGIQKPALNYAFGGFMFVLALLFSFSATVAESAPARCQSLIREFYRDGRTREDIAPMKVEGSTAGIYQHQDEREGRAFVVMETSEYLLFTISEAPDYMDGVTSRLGFDSNGEASLSTSAGNKVFRIDCKR
jgi:hypothetical protein